MYSFVTDPCGHITLYRNDQIHSCSHDPKDWVEVIEQLQEENQRLLKVQLPTTEPQMGRATIIPTALKPPPVPQKPQYKTPSAQIGSYSVAQVAFSFAQDLDLSEEDIDEIIEHGRSYPAKGATGYTYKGINIVINHDLNFLVYVGQHRHYDAYREQGQPRYTGVKTQKRLPLPTDKESFITLAKSKGFEYHQGSKHPHLTHPQVPGVQIFMPSESSDPRWIANNIADINRRTGIDLRDSHSTL